MKILLMEDDAVLSDILIDFLSESWDVDYAYDLFRLFDEYGVGVILGLFTERSITLRDICSLKVD